MDVKRRHEVRRPGSWFPSKGRATNWQPDLRCWPGCLKLAEWVILANSVSARLSKFPSVKLDEPPGSAGASLLRAPRGFKRKLRTEENEARLWGSPNTYRSPRGCPEDALESCLLGCGAPGDPS